MVRIVKTKYIGEFSSAAQIVPVSGDEIIRRAIAEGVNPIDWMEEKTEPYEKDFYIVAGVTRDHLCQVSCCPKLIKGGEEVVIRVLAVSPKDAEETAIREGELGEVHVVRKEFGYPGMNTYDSRVIPVKK